MWPMSMLVSNLEDAEIDYMITSSIASSLQGEPRLTHDIDVVVAIQKSSVDRLIEGFPPPDFYLDKNSILEAIDRQGMFNMIHVKEGTRVDFWLLKDEPFDRSRFSRRYTEEFMGLKTHEAQSKHKIPVRK